MENTDLWEELKNKFREILEGDDLELNPNNEVRKFPTTDKAIFYVLQRENDECFQLRFKIESGNSHQDIIEKLKPKFPVRDFQYSTYYTDSIWIQRQKITNGDELEKDLEKMTSIIKANLKPDTW